jgi:hypothetical protein
MPLEELGQLKNPMASSDIETNNTEWHPGTMVLKRGSGAGIEFCELDRGVAPLTSSNGRLFPSFQKAQEFQNFAMSQAAKITHKFARPKIY